MSDPYSNPNESDEPYRFGGHTDKEKLGEAKSDGSFQVGFDDSIHSRETLPGDTFYETPTGNAGLTVLAWGVILALVALLAGLNFYNQYFVVARNSVASAAEKMGVNFQSKIMIGTPLFLESIGLDVPEADDEEALQQLATVNTGPPELRFGYTILVNELVGPEQAAKELTKLRRRMRRVEVETGGVGKDDQKPKADERLDIAEGEEQQDEKDESAFQLTQSQRDVADELGRIFEALKEKDFAYVDNLDAETVGLLSKELGWVGKLAVYSKGTSLTSERKKLLAEAQSTFGTVFVLMIAVLVIGLGSILAALILFAMSAGGSLRYRFRTCDSRGGIYAETFAFWMILFLCGSFSLAALQGALQLPSAAVMVGQLVVFFGSLFALVYPLMRGVPAELMKQDIGFDFRNVFREIGIGFVGYLGILPLIVVGLILTVLTALVLSGLTPTPIHEFVSSGAGGHPIQDEIASGNLLVVIGVFLTACVAAPIVEETVFRGVLYQHLRDGSRRIPRFLSVLFSGAISSFVFAIIHPQGLLGVPVLMCLAFGFVLVREWRGSIVAPMTMHAIHNSIVTCVLLIAL